MVYGYCRCSTNETKQDVNRQKRELQKMGVSADMIFLEYESGTKIHRPELNKLLNSVTNGDTIVTTEISRIFIFPAYSTSLENHRFLRNG